MYKIGHIAKQLNVSTDTLRYYERQGLLQARTRSSAGYRLYDDSAVEQMRFIVRAKTVGFSLKDIQELLAIKIDKHNHSCEEVKSLTVQKLAQTRQRIEELVKFERSLSVLAERCCGGEESADDCSILTALEDIDGSA
ncbi:MULTISPECIES: Zn(2+)-responsive transcriptional regulator [Pseudoalteromonas]|uniref:Zn(2+)-responsive transcriptional regulator n=1 Tax=Pseudoalteromonas rubra TaxID=43658 RepID=A0A5S3UTC7_9GAMM|nr:MULTISPECIES: Zn(2+)-responsive transcriptional regulator [Pseudoalteromonas]MCG7563435.1 Zn(2+)-responsive transcriptional regulator [Pseudoalteromonas sp. McH1-42]MEC4091406.1 Zn(2+)-responsive transcriptional regulator [Pseudoalteromonas rubra]QPB82429.1 Zn(2+)-responsive transcriptional regulator [Pseudoalteromonas rubra]